MGDFKDKMLQQLADKAKKKIEQGDVECEHCGEPTLTAEVWVDDNRLEGEALCQSCNQTQPIDIRGEGTDQVGDGVDEVIDEIEDAFDSV